VTQEGDPPVAANPTPELEAFHQFLGEQLASGGSSLSPEECLELRRAQNPTGEQLSESVQALQEALDDMEASDVGQPLELFLAGVRQRNKPLTRRIARP
jgi:hypothetical protein